MSLAQSTQSPPMVPQTSHADVSDSDTARHSGRGRGSSNYFQIFLQQFFVFRIYAPIVEGWISRYHDGLPTELWQVKYKEANSNRRWQAAWNKIRCDNGNSLQTAATLQAERS